MLEYDILHKNIMLEYDILVMGTFGHGDRYLGSTRRNRGETWFHFWWFV